MDSELIIVIAMVGLLVTFVLTAAVFAVIKIGPKTIISDIISRSATNVSRLINGIKQLKHIDRGQCYLILLELCTTLILLFIAKFSDAWVIGFLFMAFGGLYMTICLGLAKEFAGNATKVIAMIMGIVGIVVLLSRPIYWIWYYLCCGFLVVDCAEEWWEYIVYSLLTLIPVIGFGGLIAICFGWNPGK